MSTTGLDQLKEAERLASELVAQARAARSERMKEAKKEAEAAVLAYRQQMEQQLEAETKQMSGASGSSTTDLERQTNEAINKMRADYNSYKAEVMERLVAQTCDVDLSGSA